MVSLTHQFRMCDDIAALSNHLIYHGQLQCATSDVANARLHLPEPQKAASRMQAAPWLAPLLHPDVTVAFVDTDLVQSTHDFLIIDPLPRN
jgi:DNA replication ATP-dependent helicase Dna2